MLLTVHTPRGPRSQDMLTPLTILSLDQGKLCEEMHSLCRSDNAAEVDTRRCTDQAADLGGLAAKSKPLRRDRRQSGCWLLGETSLKRSFIDLLLQARNQCV